MGREATCACTWGTRTGDVKVLLETHELIVRGPIRERAALGDLRDVRVDGDALRFRVGRVRVALVLGARTAASWAKRIAAPPPSLAQKFGVRAGMRVRVWGDVDAIAGDALAGTERVARGAYDLAFARIDTPARLARLPALAPVWILYAKGRAAPVGEAAVRDALRARGLIDVKTAAVDTVFTALLFRARA